MDILFFTLLNGWRILNKKQRKPAKMEAIGLNRTKYTSKLIIMVDRNAHATAGRV
jgi:hypothetical protein